MPAKPESADGPRAAPATIVPAQSLTANDPGQLQDLTAPSAMRAPAGTRAFPTLEQAQRILEKLGTHEEGAAATTAFRFLIAAYIQEHSTADNITPQQFAHLLGCSRATYYRAKEKMAPHYQYTKGAFPALTAAEFQLDFSALPGAYPQQHAQIKSMKSPFLLYLFLTAHGKFPCDEKTSTQIHGLSTSTRYRMRNALADVGLMSADSAEARNTYLPTFVKKLYR